jgi:hypothetical protein
MAEHPECDALMFTSGKCLEGMPGIGFAVARMDAIRAGAGQAGSWCMDLADVLAHSERSGFGSIRFTPPVQVLAAFDVALDLFDADGGQPARHARYRANADTLYDGFLAMGIKPYLAKAEQGPIIVTVHQPSDPRFDFARFVEALKARGVVTEDEIQDRIARTDRASPEIGARMVARAWTDPAFKERLLADGSAAIAEFGIDNYDGTHLIVIEQTPEVHNLVVCTLCSCYPRPVLGLPPDWYKSRAYRARAVRDPRGL